MSQPHEQISELIVATNFVVLPHTLELKSKPLFLGHLIKLGHLVLGQKDVGGLAIKWMFHGPGADVIDKF